MPKPQTPPAPAAEPKPEPTPQVQPPESSTALLDQFFYFVHNSSRQDRDLLSDIFTGARSGYTFPVEAANIALGSLGVDIGVDALDNGEFLKLLERFSQCMFPMESVGNNNFRKLLITALLMAETDDPRGRMNFETTLRVLAVEIEDHYNMLSSGAAAAAYAPEYVALELAKASKYDKNLLARILSILNR